MTVIETLLKNRSDKGMNNFLLHREGTLIHRKIRVVSIRQLNDPLSKGGGPKPKRLQCGGWLGGWLEGLCFEATNQHRFGRTTLFFFLWHHTNPTSPLSCLSSEHSPVLRFCCLFPSDTGH